MSRMVTLLFLLLLSSSVACAQSYDGTYSRQTSRYSAGYNTFPAKYFGFRIGGDLAHISSSDAVHSCGRRMRLNIGFAYGKGLSSSTPVYIETGLAYVAKGGRKKVDGYKYDYNLDYLEIPLVVKYMYTTGSGFGFHIFFGGFFSCGIAGSIKDYQWEASYSSFDGRDGAFRRFDAGLRFGVAASYELFYLEFAYDLGLANISHDSFRSAHTRGAILNIGVNF